MPFPYEILLRGTNDGVFQGGHIIHTNNNVPVSLSLEQLRELMDEQTAQLLVDFAELQLKYEELLMSFRSANAQNA